ncbi:hypothetical protein DEO72_LG1g2173 [Vigna unguiculata]|uniref:Uncharacterized protein n=1 Tax=Vigna unguiculata TaxID=3917 RepID=A0A4D6KS34_VIGUN|nr:hypothetical protein DEO72_LG1g2173 [Vigna unguiculata]
MIRPLLPSIADCASVHEVRVAGLALPPNNRRKGSRFRHRPALVAASVAPSVVPTSRSPSVAPSLHRALRRASVAPLRHGPPQRPLGDKRCIAAPCDCSVEYLVPPSPFLATVAPPILPGLLKTSVSWVCIIFHYHSIFTLLGS